MYRLKQLILLGGDLVLLYIGLYSALTLRHLELPSATLLALLSPFSALFVIAGLILFIAGLYDLNQAKNSWPLFQKLIIISIVWVVIGIIFFYLHPGTYLTPKTILLFTALVGFGFIALWRYLHNRFLSPVLLRNNVVFVGLTPEVVELITLLQTEPQRGFNVIGVISPIITVQPPATISKFPIAKTLHELLNLPTTPPPQLIIITPEFANNNLILQELYQHLFRQIEVLDLSRFYEELLGRIPTSTFSEAWFLTNLREQQKKVYDRFRILLDYSVALAMALFFIGTFPLIATIIKLTSPGPILFKQKRIGRAGRPFTIYKFRTMHSLAIDGSAEVAGPQFAKFNDARITRFGKFLRQTRLDEVPQCLNILQGHMSIIGPRPERPEFVEQLTTRMPFYTLRHLIKPGLTGWAQLHKSYYGTIDENLYKLEYDLFYLKHRGLILDLAILLRTITILGAMAGR